MSHYGFSRRNVLKSTAAGLGAIAAPGAAKGRTQDDEFIVGIEPGASTTFVQDVSSQIKNELDFGSIGSALTVDIDSERASRLESDDRVRYVERNGQMEALGEEIPYGIELTDSLEAIGEHVTGDDVSVAVLDTGVEPEHEVLQPNMGEGWAADGAECGDGGFPIPIPFSETADVGDCHAPWDDDHDHGTHVAGTVAAAMNDTGVVGVAPDATIHSVKVLDGNGMGDFDNIADGIVWAADQGHDVINMSLGGQESDAVSDACDYAAEKGVVIVAAAGNDGPCTDCVSPPANHPEVIAVSATTENDELAEFSSQGPEIDVGAPGEDVLSAVTGNDYDTFSGTSMASPHVAGAAASVISSGITDREAVHDALLESAEDVGLPPEEQGQGRLNVFDAIDEDGGTPPEGPAVSVSTGHAELVEDSATLHGSLDDLREVDSVDVFFEYGEEGSGLPNATDAEVFTSTGTFTAEVSGIEEGTPYEYRAVAVGEESDAGLALSFELEGDDGGFDPCFITTATHRQPETLDSLRRFRDESMSATPVGRGMIGLYYRISPPIADTLERHPESRTTRLTRKIVRVCASLSDTQADTDSPVKSASIGAALTGLYAVGIATAATGHAAIRTRERFTRN